MTSPSTATIITRDGDSREPCAICAGTSRRIFLGAGPVTIVACDGCGVRHLDPMPSAQDARSLYTDDYFRNASPIVRGYDDYEADSDNLRAMFRDRLRYLPRAGKNARLLDVGAAAGFFVEQARIAGWDAEGLELNRWAAEYARDRLQVKVREGSLEEAGYAAREFAMVTLWEVIEHVPDPRALVREIARVLQPGGYLALSTPDAGSVAARLSGRRWLGWKKIPEHVFFFDQRTLRRLLEEEGFEIVTSRYVSVTVRLAYALERLATLVGIPCIARVPRRIGNLPIRVNPLYDLMLVARRRA